MSHKASVEALDRAMRDLRNSNCPMGGCTILFSRDFRQILPVITTGTRADEVNASLIWPHITKCELKTKEVDPCVIILLNLPSVAFTKEAGGKYPLDAEFSVVNS